MYDLDEKILKEITSAIVNTISPEQIIFFGSRVDGSNDPDSDLDLLIVEKESFNMMRSRREDLRKIRRALSKFHIPKDILLFSKSEVEYWKDAVNHVIARAYKTGKVLYEKN
ncbi:MAG: nucleotidyltransferase domain-containing protein [Chlamydiae bacterium]|nr:MAG: nucleotidyltransferase domain-containing protein [Chlamydiota bacterium]